MQKKYSVKTPFFMVRNRISSLRASLRGAERLSARVIAKSGTPFNGRHCEERNTVKR